MIKIMLYFRNVNKITLWEFLKTANKITLWEITLWEFMLGEGPVYEISTIE